MNRWTVSCFLALTVLGLAAHASTREVPAKASSAQSQTLFDAKEEFDKTVSATYGELLKQILQREERAQQELKDAKNDPQAQKLLQRNLDTIQLDRKNLEQSGEWPKLLAGRSALNDNWQLVRAHVDTAYNGAFNAAILGEDGPRQDRLKAGREAFKALEGLSEWWDQALLRRAIRVGTEKDAWTFRDGLLKAPDAEITGGGWAPFVLQGALPDACVFKATVTRVTGNGALYVEFMGGGETNRIPLSPAMLAANSTGKPGDVKREHHVRIVFTSQYAAVELEGEEVWVQDTHTAGENSALAKIDGISIGSEDKKTRLSVSQMLLRPLPGARKNTAPDAKSAPEVAVEGIGCAGAVVPSIACIQAATSMRPALAEFDAAAGRISTEILKKLDESLDREVRSHPEMDAGQVRKLKSAKEGQAAQFRYRAESEPIPFDVRDASEKAYRAEWNKVEAAFAEALRKAQAEHDGSVAACLRDAKSVFDATHQLAPWWTQEQVQELVSKGEEGTDWRQGGEKWYCPYSAGADGSLKPFTVRGELPPEFILEATLELRGTSKNGLRLGIARVSGTRLDAAISAAQIETVVPQIKEQESTPVLFRLTYHHSRFTIELNRTPVWCDSVPEEPAGEEDHLATVVVTLQGDGPAAKFNVGHLQLKAIRTIKGAVFNASTNTAPASSSPASTTPPAPRAPAPTPAPSPEPEPTPRASGPRVLGTSPEQVGVIQGLRWLARYQNEDGSWSSTTLDALCASKEPIFHPHVAYRNHFDEGLTGLALLSFMGAGYDPSSKQFLKDSIQAENHQIGDVITRGLQWLTKKQNANGSFSSLRPFMYNEAIACLAVTQAFELTHDDAWKQSAQRSLDFIQGAQRVHPSGHGLWGWRYAARQELDQALRDKPGDEALEKELYDADTSVTGWCVKALNAGMKAGLHVNKESLDGGLAFAKWVSADNGLVGYIDPKSAGATVVGPGSDDFTYHPAVMSALGMTIRGLSDKGLEDPFLDLAAKQMVKDLPFATKDKRTTDYYYWYCGSIALSQFDGPSSSKKSGKYWGPWSKAMSDAILGLQNQADGECAKGGWMVPDRWSADGGPIYTTALCVLALETTLDKP